MDREQFEDNFNFVHKKQGELIIGRAKHYNTDEESANDVLANFDNVATICSILGLKMTASDVCLVLTILKMVRERSETDKPLEANSVRFDSLIDGMKLSLLLCYG